jgi:hypothetical protein
MLCLFPQGKAPFFCLIMKKPLLFLLLAIAAVVVILWLVLRPSAAPEMRASDLVAAETDILLVLPDLSGTKESFASSALGRMLRDQTVQRFLRRPLGRLAEGEAYAAARKELEALQLQNLLLAVEVQGGESLAVLIAFRSKGGPEKMEAALRRLLEEVVRTTDGDGVISESTQGNFSMRSLEVEGQTLQTALGAGWGVFSNSPAQLQAFLQRVEGETAAPALASSPEYQEVRSALPEGGEIRVFLRPNRLVEALVAFSATQGESIRLEQLAPIAQMRSLGLTAGFEGGETVERMVFFGGPKFPGGALSNPALAFAPANTLIYGSSRLHLTDETLEQMLMAVPPEMRQVLDTLAVPPAEWADLLGEEAGFFMAWPPASLLPAFVLLAETKDSEKLEALATQIGGAMAGEAIVSRAEEMTVMTWSTGGLNLVAPTLGLRCDQMFLSLTPGDLARALETAEAGDGLATTSLWKDSAAFFQGADQQISLFDLPALVQRLYTTLQPMLGFAAAMSPDLQRTVDLQLLPAPEDLNQYLGAVKMKQSTLADGMLSEVRGPVTWGSLILGLAAGLSDGFAQLHEESGGSEE